MNLKEYKKIKKRKGYVFCGLGIMDRLKIRPKNNFTTTDLIRIAKFLFRK